jgi:putative hydrolases of HD superfamily
METPRMETSGNDIAAITAFAHEVGQLKRLPRAGWLLAGVRSGESVAEHSFRVAVLAYVIAHQEGAHPEHAAVLGLFHDLTESRTGDVPSVGKVYVREVPPHDVATDQTAALPAALADHIIALVDEHESAVQPDATLEARCSRDADKLDCLLQAREYQAQTGNTQLEPWVTSMADAVATDTGRALATAGIEQDVDRWWREFAANFGHLRRPL